MLFNSPFLIEWTLTSQGSILRYNAKSSHHLALKTLKTSMSTGWLDLVLRPGRG